MSKSPIAESVIWQATIRGRFLAGGMASKKQAASCEALGDKVPIARQRLVM